MWSSEVALITKCGKPFFRTEADIRLETRNSQMDQHSFCNPHE